jgi:hypothetical protein
LNEEPPFRQDWLQTTTGRYVRMSTLGSLLALEDTTSPEKTVIPKPEPEPQH